MLSLVRMNVNKREGQHEKETCVPQSFILVNGISQKKKAWVMKDMLIDKYYGIVGVTVA